MLAFLCAAVVGSAATPPLLAAPTKMVACELFSLSDLSSVVGPNLERLTTAPESRLSYGAMRSACGYYGPRHWAIVRLAEFRSPQKANSEYAEKTTQVAKLGGGTEPVVVKSQSGIGDKASWLEHNPSHSGTGYTYVVLKGNFVFDLAVVVKDQTEGHVLMERLRSLVQEAARGL